MKISNRLNDTDFKCYKSSIDADDQNRNFLKCVKKSIKRACKAELAYILSANGSDVDNIDDDEMNWRSGWLELGPGILGEDVLMERLPKERLNIEIEGSSKILPGDLVDTGQLTTMPQLSWEPSRQSIFYTLMVLNAESEWSESGHFFHYLAYNVNGNFVEGADVAFDWVQPFSFKVETSSENSSSLATDDTEFSNSFVFLVYRQNSEVSIMSRQMGCNEALTTGDRGKVTPSELQRRYALTGPVAATAVRVPYAPGETERMICEFTRCSGRPWPVRLPGVNDNCA